MKMTPKDAKKTTKPEVCISHVILTSLLFCGVGFFVCFFGVGLFGGRIGSCCWVLCWGLGVFYIKECLVALMATPISSLTIPGAQ